METKEYLEVEGGYVISRARIHLANFQCHVRAKALRSSPRVLLQRQGESRSICPAQRSLLSISVNIHMLFACVYVVCHLTRERTNYILAQPMGRDCGGPRKAKHRAKQCLNSPSKTHFFFEHQSIICCEIPDRCACFWISLVAKQDVRKALEWFHRNTSFHRSVERRNDKGIR